MMSNISLNSINKIKTMTNLVIKETNTLLAGAILQHLIRFTCMDWFLGHVGMLM